MFQMELKKAK